MDDMTTPLFPDVKVLASGRVAYVDATGHATLETCTWVVAVPTASLYPPEADWYPDSPSDVYTEVACDAPVFAIDGDVEVGYRCSNGHEHLAYGSPRQQAAEVLEAAVEVIAQSNATIAAQLDRGEITWEQVAGR